MKPDPAFLWRFALLGATIGLAVFHETGWAIFCAVLLVVSLD